jgi:hypothetical protein
MAQHRPLGLRADLTSLRQRPGPPLRNPAGTTQHTLALPRENTSKCSRIEGRLKKIVPMLAVAPEFQYPISSYSARLCGGLWRRHHLSGPRLAMQRPQSVPFLSNGWWLVVSG